MRLLFRSASTFKPRHFTAVAASLTAAEKLRGFSTSESANKSAAGAGEKVSEKPSICTAEELHYVPVPGSNWRVALWRYIPPPQAPSRNHPLLLLSGIGTNAIAYEISPECSFARYLCNKGFDTWIVEVRGAGLSMEGIDSNETEKSAKEIFDKMEDTSGSNVSNAWTDIIKGDPTGIPTISKESRVVTKLTEAFMHISERLFVFLSESQAKMSASLLNQISSDLECTSSSDRFDEIGEKISSLLEARQNSFATNQISDLMSQKLVNLIEGSQNSVSPRLFSLHENLSSTIEDLHNKLGFLFKYGWDFDNYLEEDIPAAVRYIRAQSTPKDGKLLAIGHSMGGILLYAMLSRCGFEGRDAGLAAVVTLASSLDYSSSKSLLKLLLPLANIARALNVPAVPLGALVAAAYPLLSHPPYGVSWLNHLISAENMMQPEWLNKLSQKGFCTISIKLLLQLATAFREGGLRDRTGKFLYKDHIHRSKIPVLVLAADAVYETVKEIPEDLVTYKVFGNPESPHYAHYDLIGSRAV